MFVGGLFIVLLAELYFFSSDSLNCAASIVRVRVLKSSYQQIDIYIFQIFLSPKKSRDGKFQTKKKSLDHLSNFNSPPPLHPPPRAGPRVRYYCLRCSFWLLVVVRNLISPFLCLSWFLSVWKYPNALCNCIAIWLYKASVKHMSSTRASYHGLNWRLRRRVSIDFWIVLFY